MKSTIKATIKSPMKFPKMVLAEQRFENNPVKDVARDLKEQLRALSLSKKIFKGQSVAITAGSRGVTDMTLVLKTLVQELKIGRASCRERV